MICKIHLRLGLKGEGYILGFVKGCEGRGVRGLWVWRLGWSAKCTLDWVSRVRGRGGKGFKG